jgi:hypothetical protein
VNPREGKPGFSKLKLTFIILIIAGVAGGASYGYYVYTVFLDSQVNMPQSQLEKLVRDLRSYHLQRKQFPAGFAEVNHLIWHTNPAPNYGADGRRARAKNYHYYYSKVDDGKCAVWALPLGPQRQYASAFFLVISPEWVRVWKGKALDDGQVEKIPAIPTPDDLAALNLREMPARVLTSRK